MRICKAVLLTVKHWDVAGGRLQYIEVWWMDKDITKSTRNFIGPELNNTQLHKVLHLVQIFHRATRSGLVISSQPRLRQPLSLDMQSYQWEMCHNKTKHWSETISLHKI